MTIDALTAPSEKTSLHRWASVHTELLWIYDGPFAAGIPNQETDHRCGYWVWLMRKGSVRVRMGDESWVASEGQWMICPQGIATQEFSSDAQILSVHFQCEWPIGENLFAERSACVFDSAHYADLLNAASELHKLVRHHFPNVTLDLTLREVEFEIYLHFQQLFCVWLREFRRVWKSLGHKLIHAEEASDYLRKATRFLHSCPLDTEFPRQELERATGLYGASLTRLFLREYKVTARQYWELLREKSARQYLQQEAPPIKEIAFRLGFKQPSHFTKWFSRRSGAAPHVYRKRGAENWIR
ncbi:MAG: helix-turn-helix domain-containing protein [Candidatus Methylacidiphilales bacterium]